MAAAARDFRWPVDMVTVGADLNLSWCGVRRRMRIRKRLFGLSGKRLLIAMATQAFVNRGRDLGRSLVVTLRTGKSCAVMGIEKQSIVRIKGRD
ncbi:hypothetical protein ACVJGD_003271 [Bradyrhizobium sp. USDA 10063]